MARGPTPWGRSDAKPFLSSAQAPDANTTRRALVAPGVAASPAPPLEWVAERPAALYGGRPRPARDQLGVTATGSPSPAGPVRGGAGGKTRISSFLSGRCGAGVAFGPKGRRAASLHWR